MQLSNFLGGDNRIQISYLASIPIYLAPTVLLILLTIIPIKRIPAIVKQIIAVPLLIADFMIPFGFTNGDRIFATAVCCINFNMFLRFLEIYFVNPIVLGGLPYISFDKLSQELWATVRKFPVPATEDNEKKGIKKGDVKVYTKDRKFYHIILYLLMNIVLIDVFGALIMTFEGHEVMYIQRERPVLFMVLFLIATLILTSTFNCIGFVIHLTYCILYEKGSYSSEQYRLLMKHPIISSSLDDLWSNRWHSLFKSTWLAFPFRPVRIYTERFLAKKTKNAKKISYLAGSLAVFAASSLMHEYIIISNVGIPVYKRLFFGEQSQFFMYHGLGVLFENLIRFCVLPYLPTKFKNSITARVICQIWVLFFCYCTFQYILNGFIMWGMQYDNPIKFLHPYVIEAVRKVPALHGFLGSRLATMI
ncbi:hypothetical protein BDB01DRAFT_754658 [Pilobolus umbonatus]|nr:hypothetical protein BDB01DRAFT_754658 [Pilobolus umbonatus]